MTYSFQNLSSADFEDLVRDLVGRELNVRFEAFCAGPDGGLDGRHAPNENATIVLQAKHYEGSPFSKLKSVMKRERASIDKLSPSRYVLATSCKFTPVRKAELAKLIGPSLRAEDDIFGPGDLNALLRKYPEILKAHIKLWLTGTGVLERILHSAAAAFSTMTIEEIEEKVRVYARNPSFDISLDKLEKHHVLIISGPPGVGKTTLAEMLCYTFLGEDWELVPIRSLEDGFSAINDSKKQIFFFDDFLGRVALDKQALAHKDSELTRFMSRVKRSPNARFVLTTRGYIFEEAKQFSEHISDARLEVTKYVLDVGIYTRRIKARILYNHLFVAETPKLLIRALIDSDSLSSIVDHRNYNPRIIEFMTDTFRTSDMKPEEYPVTFLNALDHPTQIWDTAFRNHIDGKCQDLLLAMFFASEFGVSIPELRSIFTSVHATMCKHFGRSHGLKDYEEALRTLEGSFVSIQNNIVTYQNPSLKDYLSSYMKDTQLLTLLAPTANSVDWTHAFWQFVCREIPNLEDQKQIGRACINLTEMITTRPIWQPVKNKPNVLVQSDASNSTRLRLLIELWQITDEIVFANAALAIAKDPIQGFETWRDGEPLLELILSLDEDEVDTKFVYADELKQTLENALYNLISWHMNGEELEHFSDLIDERMTEVPTALIAALQTATAREFDEISDRISEETSESSLSDLAISLERLALRYGISEEKLAYAVSIIDDRIIEIEERAVPSSSPEWGTSKKETDDFDDIALKNLFSPLLEE